MPPHKIDDGGDLELLEDVQPRRADLEKRPEAKSVAGWLTVVLAPVLAPNISSAAAWAGIRARALLLRAWVELSIAMGS